MEDQGTWIADQAQAALEARMERIYRQAQEDIVKKLDAHTKRMNAKDKVKRAQLTSGEITEEQYNKWLNGQVFAGKLWRDKVDSIAATLLRANQHANAAIEGEKRAVFGQNASFQAFGLEKTASMDLSFTIYDSATVTRLLREQPQLLPQREVDAKKDQVWNRHKIANVITQGTIQGESVPKIAKRLSEVLPDSNKKAMTRYARTAMTSAQNAGRIEVMHESQKMGIKVKKVWVAVADERTRAAHLDLNGQVQDVDEPFDSELGPIMYPGDPNADEANVWNCRCALGYEYEEYPSQEVGTENGYDWEYEEELSDMDFEGWIEYKGGDPETYLSPDYEEFDEY